jgi:hypothetical protein
MCTHTWVSIKKCVNFSSNTPSSNVYWVTSNLFGLIRVFEVHLCWTTFFTIKKMPFDFFSFTDKDHKKSPIESITLCHKIAPEMFLTCTPIVLVITLLENSMRAFTITVSKTCFVVRLTPLLTCLFYSKTLVIPITTSCWARASLTCIYVI